MVGTFFGFQRYLFFSNEPKSPVVKPQKEGDIWDRIGHTAPNPIVNGEVSQFTEFPQLPEFRRLTAPFQTAPTKDTRDLEDELERTKRELEKAKRENQEKSELLNKAR